MAPTRLAPRALGGNENATGITTRSKQLATMKGYQNMKVPSKRKADSPVKDATAKRAAFGDITNAYNKSVAAEKEKNILKKVTVETKVLPTLKSIKQPAAAINGKPSKAKQLQKAATNAIESVQKHFTKDVTKAVSTRAQNGILKNIDKKEKLVNGKESASNSANSRKSDTSGEPSLYMTALETTSPLDSKEEFRSISEKLDKVVLDDDNCLEEENEQPHKVPEGVADFDQENWTDPYQVSCYAMDIFNYMRSREKLYPIDDYLERVRDISPWMRSLLVDWMVEVQESFELNHETLYLAVKLVDLFLTRTSSSSQTNRPHTHTDLGKERLQLLGASSLYIAAKYDERIPPLVDDFLYICDGAYSLSQLLRMEADVLRAIDFNLGIPLSYRFLRRYARCARVSMPTLTLARYVLELSLMEYTLVSRSDSKMAASALHLALRMKNVTAWTPALSYYSGYSLPELLPTVLELNAVLHKKQKAAISTIRNKYSHTIFFEVAKTPLLDDAALVS